MAQKKSDRSSTKSKGKEPGNSQDEQLLRNMTLTGIFQERSSETEKGVTFITERGDEFVSYSRLNTDALSILGNLQSRGLKPDDEVVFQVVDPGDFIRIFWACILGGFIPVPVAVRNNDEHQLKLFRVWEILGNKYLVTTEDILNKLDAFARKNKLDATFEEFKANNIIISGIDREHKEGTVYNASPEKIAYIQFSSGTTGDPKGVILTHKNLLANLTSIIKASKMSSNDAFLSWMPLSHDMGLIGYHMTPTILGINQYIMPTAIFLIRPTTWFEKAAQYRATILSSPNFGYKHYLTFFKENEIPGNFDLSCVRLIFNGAEPISRELGNRFLDKMEKFGLKKKVMYPVYGLAEASLAAAFPPPEEEEIQSVTLAREFLEVGGTVKEVEHGDPGGVNFVDVGYPLEGSPLRIVDEHNRPVPESVIGNIQIKGDNVTSGYYKNQAATNRVKTPDGWLDTGDLGLMKNGRLIITGRAKDIIFVNGQNYYSHDIERVAENVAGIELGRVAVLGAFSKELQEDEIIAFIQNKDKKLKEMAILAIELKKYIYAEMGLKLNHMIPVLRIPKTTSGKIQRNKLREAYTQGEYEHIIKDLWELIEAEFENQDRDKTPITAHDNSRLVILADERDLLRRIRKDIVKIVSKLLMIREKEIDLDRDMDEFGFNSITLTQMTNDVNKKYNLGMTPSVLFEHRSIGSFALYLQREYKDFFLDYYHDNVKMIATMVNHDPAKETGHGNRLRSSGVRGIRQYIKTQFINEPVAIIGMSGMMPQSENLEVFWRNLEDGKDMVSEIPKNRWDWEEYYGDPKTESNRTNVKWGGFIKSVDKFDAAFFGISPREAELMDPQQRIFMETVWRTIENAGYKASDLAGTKTALFAGVATTDYNELLKEHSIEIKAQTSTGVSHSLIANRISYMLDLYGPSEAIDTACSSSLVALHRAVEAVRSEKCDMAIAGGVNVILSPTLYISFSKAGMLSEDGRCKTFDSRANGYVRGEGVGAILLKTVNRAIANGDYIFGVLKGSAVNHGGHANSLTAPNPNAQAELLISAYEGAQIDPATVSYIETHGTGTDLGDPIEINGLKKAFRELFYISGKSAPKEPYCGIGSVKTNIGHLETAAGIAGVIKVLMSMLYKKIPGNLHFKELNPYIKLDDSPFYIVTETRPWERLCDDEGKPVPRRAGVSSFGFGGSNAHVVIEEFDNFKELSNQKNKPPWLMVLSAKNKERLETYAKKMYDYLKLLPDRWEDFLMSASDPGCELKEPEEEQQLNSILANIAYTLQVGRESMEERLAFVVCSFDELTEKLLQYCRREDNIQGFYTNNIKDNKIKNSARVSMKDFLAIIGGQDLIKLAELWVAGIEIEWELLHKDFTPRRIPLPAYPFARKRYWIPESDENGTAGKKGNANKLHPLIDINSSTLEEQRFTTLLNGSDFYLQDYTWAGQKVMPAAACIEMARVVGELSGRESVQAIKNGLWVRPIVLDHSINELYSSVYPEGTGFRFEISGKEENGTRQVYFQAEIDCSGDDVVSNIEEKLDIESVKTRCKDRIGRNEFYEKTKKLGLNLKSGFTVVQELYCRTGEAAAYLSIPPKLKSTFNEYVLHPSLFEGALQMLGVGLIQEPFRPLKLDEVKILRPLQETCYVYAREIQGEHKKFDILIVDEQGRVLAVATNLTAELLSEDVREKTPAVVQENIECLFFRSRWQKADIQFKNTGSAGNSKTGTLLVFDNGSDIGNALRERLEREDTESRVILVQAGEMFCVYEDLEFEIDPKNEHDYRQLLEFLEEENLFPRKIVHLWSQESFSPEQEVLKEQLGATIYSLFFLSKIFMQQKPKEKIEMLYLYPGSEKTPQPHYGAVSGFAKSVVQENPRFVYKTIEIRSNSKYFQEMTTAGVADFILGEFAAGDTGGSEILYEGEHRYIRVPEEFNLDKEITENEEHVQRELLKENGVYLITGGTGGLGAIFAEFLAKTVKAKLVLTGRSALNSVKKAQIKKLESMGAEVVYIKADVSEQKLGKKLVITIKSRFKQINGIIHCAGVTRDSLIVRKTFEDMEAVLAPKVYGTVYLDSATKDESLDFFVLFSSLAAVQGNAGQACYAYANSFLDRFAEQRESLRIKGERSGKTISVNWPLWQDGGMEVDEQVLRMLSGTMGMHPLSRETGIDVFSKALLYEGSCFLVIEGERNKATRALGLNIGKPTEDAKVSIQQDIERNSEDLLEQIRHKIVSMAGSILRIDEDTIEPGEDLSEYGFESITLTEFVNVINDTFNLTLKPPVFYEHPSLESLSRFLCEEYKPVFIDYFEKSMKENFLHREVQSFSKTYGSESRFRIPAPRESGQEKPGKENIQGIAIIGISGVMPQSPNMEIFWHNLEKGKDLVRVIPPDRWDWEACFGDPKKEVNKTDCKWGGFMEDADKFDASFFGISPREAELMDPQQRIFLETVWTAIEDAGYKPSDFSGTKTALFVGVATTEYNDILRDHSTQIDARMATGISHSITANRISYLLNIHGPSEAIDTACSSSLVAVHRGVTAIENSNCEMALVGGVNFILNPEVYISLSKAGFLSINGRCKTFDAGANGYVRGEGAGVVLLKSLDQALADRDHIYGVIRGSSENHGGHVNSLTTPNPNAQAELLIEAYEKSDIDPATITYIEAHGTGTGLGDPIEVNGLRKAFKKLYQRRGKIFSGEAYCGLGSVKTNIGHLETAAGIAGLLKVVLAMKNHTLPASIHCKELNPYIELENSPFYIVRETISWKALKDTENREIPRRAGISSFGFGGTNAHVVIEEVQCSKFEVQGSGEGEQVVVLSAKTKEGLDVYVGNLLRFLEEREPVSRVRQDLVEIAAGILKVDEKYIEFEDDMREYGFDTVTIALFANTVNEKYNTHVDLPAFFNTLSIQSFASLLCEANNEAVNTHEHTLSPFFRDIAYTLQVGREAMEERLAIVASTVMELKKKLAAYCGGYAAIKDLCQGNIKSRTKSEKIFEGREGEEFLKIIIDDRKLAKLGKLWVSGVSVDWKLLYSDCLPNRISLPTYPFQRERFWVPETGKPGRDRKFEGLHPVLDSNESTLEEQCFKKILTGDEFFLRDFIVGQNSILPGVVYLEMARVAGEHAGLKTGVRRLKNIVWARPVTVDVSSPEVFISLYPGENLVEFEVATRGNEQKLVHAQGEISVEKNRESQQSPEFIDINAVKERCIESKSSDECYRLFRTAGLQYGPALQSIKELFCNNTEALSYLELPLMLKGDFKDFILHPSLMDGALQTVLGVMDGSGNLPGASFVPFALGDIEILDSLPETCYAYVTEVSGEQPETHASHTIKKFMIRIIDSTGRVLIKMKDFSVRAMEHSAPLPVRMYFQPVWEPQETGNPNTGIDPGSFGPLLVFDTKEKVSGIFKERLRTPGISSPVIHVRAGKTYKNLGDLEYEINPARESDYRQLMDELKMLNLEPEKILHLWAGNSFVESKNALKEQLNTGLYSLFYLSKILWKKKSKNTIRLVYCYPRSLDKPQPQFEAVSGFVKSLRLENPRLLYKTLEIISEAGEQYRMDSPALLDRILAEFDPAADNDVETRYDGDIRFVKQLTEYNPDDEVPENETLRENGVYLLTGGTGGLGLVFAEYLARKVKARLVLTGRSRLNREKRARIKELESLGAEVVYIQADVSREEKCRELAAAVKSRFNEINGVLHCAGVTKDALTIKKTRENMEAVLAPKVQGTVFLDEAFKNEKLDFFVLFSGLAAVIGNIGQSDYAFANSFMDSFAGLRESLVNSGERNGKTISINWPLWKDGGMSVDEETEKFLENTMGMKPLDRESGIDIFEKTLAGESGRVIPVVGDSYKIKQV
ncbi:MAG: SDR family NAD(P)-dependent oxidoreductase, partial [bacterium]|nr:SDR family NAD(P)-dependent oxidoreductase [bacterium]